MVLVGVSRTGRFALLAPDGRFDPQGLFRIGVYVLLHIPTGRQHRIHLDGFAGIPPLGELVAFMPAALPMSPNERLLILQSYGLVRCTTLLCSVPEDWPGEGL